VELAAALGVANCALIGLKHVRISRSRSARVEEKMADYYERGYSGGGGYQGGGYQGGGYQGSGYQGGDPSFQSELLSTELELIS